MLQQCFVRMYEFVFDAPSWNAYYRNERKRFAFAATYMSYTPSSLEVFVTNLIVENNKTGYITFTPAKIFASSQAIARDSEGVTGIAPTAVNSPLR